MSDSSTRERNPLTVTQNDAPLVPEELAPGTLLDQRFEIVSRLGEGGMGRVFEAIHLVFGKKIALKVLHSIGDHDEVAEQRFLEEARILERLDHPHIVKVRDAGVTTDGILFIVMELLKGNSLRDWIEGTPSGEKGPEYIDEFIGYVIDVLDGLQEAHDHNVIHRDLKPSNVFLHEEMEDGDLFITPKIIDFGIAKRGDRRDMKLTLDGQVPGTSEYTAPELKLGDDPDVRSDIYAVGVILYEGLTGKKPAPTKRDDAIFSRAEDKRHRIRPVKEVNPNVSHELNHICMRALEPDPVRRFQTTFELGEKLVNLPAFRSRSGHGASTPKRRRRIMAIAGSALLIAVGVLAVLLWPRAPEQMVVVRSEDSDPSAQTDKPRKAPSIDTTSTQPQADGPKESETQPQTESSPKLAESSVHGGGRRANGDRPSRTKVETGMAPVSRAPKEEAPSDTEKKKKEDEERFHELLDEGQKALRNGNYKGAYKMLDEAVRIKPRTPAAWADLAKIAFHQNRFQDAVDNMNQALGYQDRASWRFSLGQYLLKMGKTARACEEWKKVLQDYPNDARSQKRAETSLDRYCGGE